MGKKHVMIDLETLGVGDHAAIIQIGLITFGPDVDKYTGLELNVLAFYWKGGIEPDTMLWWLRQSPEARECAFNQKDAVSLPNAIRQTLNFLDGADTLWADSPNFDIRLLRQAFERVGSPWPFSHRIERDLRTLKAIPGARDVEPERNKHLEHMAIEDAVHQARWVEAIYKMLGKELQ